jgi:hypothetical protein
MNRWIQSLLSLATLIVLLLTGCQPKAKTLLPITGGQDVTLASSAELARDTVLDYILSSSRFATLPPGTDWEVEVGEQPEGIYQFRNGDWLILVRLPNAHRTNEQILLINKIEQISWTGYITPDSRVVDTSYSR